MIPRQHYQSQLICTQSHKTPELWPVLGVSHVDTNEGTLLATEMEIKPETAVAWMLPRKGLKGFWEGSPPRLGGSESGVMAALQAQVWAGYLGKL